MIQLVEHEGLLRQFFVEIVKAEPTGEVYFPDGLLLLPIVSSLTKSETRLAFSCCDKDSKEKIALVGIEELRDDDGEEILHRKITFFQHAQDMPLEHFIERKELGDSIVAKAYNLLKKK